MLTALRFREPVSGLLSSWKKRGRISRFRQFLVWSVIYQPGWSMGMNFPVCVSKSILLVGDDPINRSVELSMLKRMGVEADSATHGREAVTTNAPANDEGKCLDSGMNDYLSKPMQFNDLVGKLMQWLTTGEGLDGESSGPTAAVLCNVAAVDRLWSLEQALLHTGGDEVLLHEVISLFHGRYPILMAELKSAIENQDAVALMASAHIFKSNLAYFSSTDAVALVNQLEQAGKDNRFSDLRLVYQQLAELVSLLADELERYRSGLSSLQ